MFLEPRFYRDKEQVGWIEVVCGSMFSGKTEELIRRINRAVIAQQKVRICKPDIDTRYDDIKVVSHNQNSLEAIPLRHSKQLLELAQGYQVVGIDEAQFFDEGLAQVCVELANSGIRVIVCGLDMDYLGNPFGAIPALMSLAEYVTKLHAICMCCGDVALYSFRLTKSDEKVLLGEKNEYEARCRRCFVAGMTTKKTSL